MDLILLMDTEIPIENKKIIRNEGKMEWNRHILIKKKKDYLGIFFLPFQRSNSLSS